MRRRQPPPRILLPDYGTADEGVRVPYRLIFIGIIDIEIALLFISRSRMPRSHYQD
jgi:hypothetical protein